MQYRTLGHSGIKVSSLVLGTMTFGGDDPAAPVGYTSPAEAKRMLDRSIDTGVNLIDTADFYKTGATEEVLGELLVGRRDDILLATKARFPVGEGPNDEGASRYHLIRACEASLRRLRTDHIDLYQVHEWDGTTPLEETLDTLDTLIHQGKVRYVGCSNYSAWHVMKALGTSARLGLQRFVSQQVYYSLIGRDVESELVPVALDQNLGILVWSPLAGGLLSGKYRRGVDGPSGSRHTTGWPEPPIDDWNYAYSVIETATDIARVHNVSTAQVALAWLLRRPGITSVVVGARNETQLADNLAAVDLDLDDEEQAALDKVSLRPLSYPYWHQAAPVDARLSPADRALTDLHVLPRRLR